MLRTCYVSDMRLYPDRPDVLTRGRWAFCPDDALALPFPTVFTSSREDPNDFELRDGLGEVREIQGYSSGFASPRYTGRTHCGPAELFLNGSPFALQGTPATDADGVPLCCLAPPALGGLALGGAGAVSSWADVALWLRPEELAGLSEGDAVADWPRAPLTPRDAGPLSPSAPTYHVDAGTLKGGVQFNGESPFYQDLSFPPLTADGDFTTYVVARQMGPSAGGPLLGNLGFSDWAPLLSRTTAVVQAGGGTALAGPPSSAWTGKLALWSARRRGNQLELWQKGAQVAATTDLSLLPLTLNYVASQLQTFGHHQLTWIAEVIVFTRALTAGEDDAIWQYLETKYKELDVLPTGLIADFANDTPQDGWLMCDGSSYPSSSFPSLSAYLGGAYDTHRGASAPPSGEFRVPDFRGLVLAGGGAASVNPTTSAYAEGDTAGEETHLLTNSETPSHNHGVTDPGHNHAASFSAPQAVTTNKGAVQGLINVGFTVGAQAGNPGLAISSALTGLSIQFEGGGGDHNNIQPTGVGFKFIKT